MFKSYKHVTHTENCVLPNLQQEELKEEKWLQQYVSTDTPKSWAPYHIGESERDPPSTEDINSLLTLLRDKVSTLSMLAHTMRLNQKVLNPLNTSQTPVDVSDFPVFALTKEAKYRLPAEFSKYF